MSVFAILLLTLLKNIFSSELVQSTSENPTVENKNEFCLDYIKALTIVTSMRNESIAENLLCLQGLFTQTKEVRGDFSNEAALKLDREYFDKYIEKLKSVHSLNVTEPSEFKEWKMGIDQKAPEFKFVTKYMKETERLEKLEIELNEKLLEINQYFENVSERLKSKKHDE